MKRWFAALLLFISSASVCAQGEKPKLGIVMSLSGTMALTEAAKLSELQSQFAGFELVVLDAASVPGNAVKLVERLRADPKIVGILLGAIPINEVRMIGELRPKIPIISLAPTANPALAKEASQYQITTFVQPSRQVRELQAAIPKNESFFVTTTPLYSAAPNVYGEVLKSKTIGGETIDFGFDASSVLGESKRKGAVFVAMSDLQSSKQLLNDMKAADAKGFVISAPSPERITNIASDLSKLWLESGDLSQAGWNRVKGRSAYFEGSTGALAVGWEVTTSSFQFAGAFESTCRCKSKDGRVTKSIPCTTPPERCVTTVYDDDCNCGCAAR
jgi:hypothetical protein